MKIIIALLNNIIYVIGTLCGVGFIKFAPGTIGSLVIALVWILLPDYLFYNPLEKALYYDSYFILTFLILFLGWISVYICQVCEKKFGRDACCIVIDEVFGYLVAILFLPKTIIVALYALVIFRIFDITKPIFINKIQELPHGWGIMLDDIAAGILTNLVLQMLFFIKPQFFLFF